MSFDLRRSHCIADRGDPNLFQFDEVFHALLNVCAMIPGGGIRFLYADHFWEVFTTVFVEKNQKMTRGMTTRDFFFILAVPSWDSNHPSLGSKTSSVPLRHSGKLKIVDSVECYKYELLGRITCARGRSVVTSPP